MNEKPLEQNERHCSGCGYPLAGNETESECPVCIPIERMKIISRNRSKRFYLEMSQPKEN